MLFLIYLISFFTLLAHFSVKKAAGFDPAARV